MRSLAIFMLMIHVACSSTDETGPPDASVVSNDSGAIIDAGSQVADSGWVGADTGISDDAAQQANDAGFACGNGSTDGAEECDDGNALDGDGCSALCTIEHGEIELAQEQPRATIENPIRIRGSGFRYQVELQVCILQDGGCRFALGTLQTSSSGRIEDDQGDPAVIQVDQPLEALVALCDEALGTCSNGLSLAWILPQSECEEDADCRNGQRCERNQCIEAPPRCADDIDCPPGQSCNDGECRTPNNGRCQDNSQCPDLYLCLDGRCVEPDRNCGAHADCPMHQVCNFNNGECELLPAGVCRNDDPCQLRCQIPQGSELGVCIDCERDDQCPQGAVCNGQGQCDAPRCNADNCPAPGRCENDQCVGGEGCNNQNCPPPGRCENNMCVRDEQPQLCQQHADCDGTQQCIQIDGRGACVSRCNEGDQAQFCAGLGGDNCICNMLAMRCNQQSGLCERP